MLIAYLIIRSRKVILERGLNIYSVIIESEDIEADRGFLNDRYTIYLVNRDNFEKIKTKITGLVNKRFPIVEESTFLSRFSSSEA